MHTPHTHAHTHFPVSQNVEGVCVCLYWGVAICVNSLLPCVCVCVSQDRDIEGEEEEEEAVTTVSKVNSATSQLFGCNTDTNTLFASKLIMYLHTFLPLSSIYKCVLLTFCTHKHTLTITHFLCYI